MTASFTLSKKKIRYLLRNFPIFNTKHHVIDRQGTRNVPFHETNSIASVSQVRTSSALLLDSPIPSPLLGSGQTKIEFQLTLDDQKAAAAYFPNM